MIKVYILFGFRWKEKQIAAHPDCTELVRREVLATENQKSLAVPDEISDPGREKPKAIKDN